VQTMIAAGAETFLEFGSKDVLVGLIKRIDRSKTGRALNSADTLRAFIAEQ
jgi:malonyl CoA-acyl carrier protein transacylase